MRRLLAFVAYVFAFVVALVRANLDVARLVLSPRMRLRPGFLAVPMEAESDLEITFLANSITLTPGTISVHVAHDHRMIVIHALDVGDDPDALRRDIRNTLEARILRWTRGPGWRAGGKT
jgi:multicomponent Na+:H+ antiporter subunit E